MCIPKNNYFLVDSGWKSNSGFSYQSVVENLGTDLDGFVLADYISEHYTVDTLAVVGVDDIRFTVVMEKDDVDGYIYEECDALWLSDVIDLSEVDDV